MLNLSQRLILGCVLLACLTLGLVAVLIFIKMMFLNLQVIVIFLMGNIYI